MFQTEIKVRYAETDRMGIVHHSRYFPWFEVGRTEFFAQSGMSYGQVEEMGVLLPLIQCDCSFIEGARYEDVLLISVSISELGAVRITFNYDVTRKSDGKILARGFTKHAFVNSDFRPVNLVKFKPDIYNKLVELAGNS